MPRYSVTGAVVASKYIGTYEAHSPKEAFAQAAKDAGVSLCHECAREVSDPEVEYFTAEDEETGDCTSEYSPNDQIVEQAAEIRRLKSALAHIADTCVQCPDTAQFAARIIDGSAEWRVQNAFTRGAEEMREACAQWVDHWVSGHVADKLRDLPIPEET